MSEYYIGIDSGTQSTKSILFDAESGEVVAGAVRSYDLIEGLPAGHKEQNPTDWVGAVRETILELLSRPGVDRQRVRGIGVSGQQHGFVALDDQNIVIRAAKLWCDTSTSPECAELMTALGGLAKTIDLVGNGIPAGFTASKILWMKNHEPGNYARLARVLLPHDYLNLFLTGRHCMECGDASGTGLLDVRRRQWSLETLAAIDPALEQNCPRWWPQISRSAHSGRSWPPRGDCPPGSGSVRGAVTT